MSQNPSPDQSFQNHFFWRFIKRLHKTAKFFIISLLALCLLLALFLLFLHSQPLPTPEIPIPTKIYDDQGKVMDQMTAGEQREYVSLKGVPKHLIQATLATEDGGFYNHFGFSPKGIIRAIWSNLKAGEIAQGASTITQQLARNLYLTQDRTWKRKIKEAMFTLQLELHYNKNQILEMYLNKINYGHGAYGIGKAAQVFFAKKAENLTLAESALLVGIPRGPALYSPYRHYDRAKKRQQHTLNLMVAKKMITPIQAQKAKATPLNIVKMEKTQRLNAHYFRDYVLQTAVHQYGLEDDYVQSGGLHIYTTLNMDLQRKAERAVQKHLSPSSELQGALLSVDPHNGYIRAMVGGKDYRRSQYNRVFAQRQPGSAFKPFLYLEALKQGFTPTTQIVSRPTSFVYEGGVYKPTNYQNQYPNRAITLREAIAKSDNIYAVSTIFQTGIDSVIDLAHRLGIKSSLQPTPSLALGSYATSPFELTKSYTTIASGGTRYPLTGILRITDRQGKILVDEKPQGTNIISPAYTYILTRLLTSVLEPGGTAHRVRQLFDQPAAGKSGSTNWDGWFSGFTPDLVTTVWVGYDKGKELPHAQARRSQYIWGDYMNQAQNHMKQRLFKIPSGVKGVYIDPETGYLATPFCKQARLEYYVKGTEPTKSCPIHSLSKPPVQDKSWWEKALDWW